MSDPDDPVTNPQRLAALRRTGLLDSPPEEEFDRLARAAAEKTGAPVALVSIVDEDRQFFKSSTSVGGIFAAEKETTLGLSLCRHAVAAAQPLLLPDARAHPEFRSHQAVREGHVGAYAGYPITLEGGHAIGTICVLDSKPREWGEQHIEMLRPLAATVAEVVARHVAATDAKAWRSAKRAGLAGSPTTAEGEAAGISALPSFLDSLERGAPSPNERSPVDIENGLIAAVSFYLRQIDVYIASLGTSVEAEPARRDQLRSAVVSAEAGLLRALEAFDLQQGKNVTEGAGASQQGSIHRLRECCAAFLEAERRLSRTSLLARRAIAGIDELEQAVRTSSAAEQTMRLAFREYEMHRE